MIDERIAQRRRQVREQRRQHRLRRTVTLVLLAVVAVALVVVERSDLVALEEVEVVGTDRLEVEAVIAAADLPLGTSTLRLRLGDAEARVEGLPLVREATARRLDPLTVQIEVVERVPAVNVTGDGEQVLVDRDGVVIEPGRLDGLPEIVVSVSPPAPGERVDALPALANAHRAWRGLSGPLRTEVVRYRAGGPDALDLELASGVLVHFGRAERVDEKVRALGAVLEDLDGTPVASIDVRAPSTPVITPP
ncbi:MAG TPA: FtsQ-type POTRA domain-containing protein [Egicoccus sp.]|nr:FtsQ-type POTRA domain-containing protein [Egicoccus sp.]HSK22360.1 FtsQ-type POTRA domain-containing protein [Egicoccus sp.]